MIAMQYGSSGQTRNGGIVLDLLWENSDPTSSFAAQSISVNLSSYKMFGLVMWYSTTTQEEVQMQLFTVDENTKYPMVSGNNNRGGTRSITYDAANAELSISAATYNSATNNAYLIPLRIYGLR